MAAIRLVVNQETILTWLETAVSASSLRCLSTGLSVSAWRAGGRAGVIDVTELITYQ